MSQIRPFLEITTASNGNQTRDMSRGVASVSYNALNLPRRVEFATGARIDYHYSASGTKLAETVYGTDGSLVSRRDYVGQFEFVADTLERTLLPEGFITESDGAFHAFIPDHQGSIAGVYNSATNSLEQFTDYYPYGLPHASATAPEANRRKYGAKELTTDLGLNLYDFAARFHNPAFPAFTTPDPLAETFKGVSPYLFCNGDPINLIDPSGMKFRDQKEADNLKESTQSRIDYLSNSIITLITQLIQHFSNHDFQNMIATVDKINETIHERSLMELALSDINYLENNTEYTFAFCESDGTGAHYVRLANPDSKLVYIMTSSEAISLHEIAHIRQSLKSKHGIFFNSEGLLQYSSQLEQIKVKNEVESYRIQYSYNQHSLPIQVCNIFQIDIVYLTRIYDANHRPAYDFAHNLLNYFKQNNYDYKNSFKYY